MDIPDWRRPPQSCWGYGRWQSSCRAASKIGRLRKLLNLKHDSCLLGAESHFVNRQKPPVIYIYIFNIPFCKNDYRGYIWIINHLLCGMHIQVGIQWSYDGHVCNGCIIVGIWWWYTGNILKTYGFGLKQMVYICNEIYVYYVYKDIM